MDFKILVVEKVGTGYKTSAHRARGKDTATALYNLMRRKQWRKVPIREIYIYRED